MVPSPKLGRKLIQAVWDFACSETRCSKFEQPLAAGTDARLPWKNFLSSLKTLQGTGIVQRPCMHTVHCCASGLEPCPLPIALGQRTGVPWAQRLCHWCNLHPLHDGRHLEFERLPCSACGIGMLPCSVLLQTPCTCLCCSEAYCTVCGGGTLYHSFEVLGTLDDASTTSSSVLAAR